MGIHGLTTYLRENRAAVAQTLQFSSRHDGITPLVIDAWSFIYEVIGLSNLPWVYGGEYGEFSTLVEAIIRAWVGMGLQLYFVFDGPYEEIKFPTIVGRMTKSVVQPSLLFFRTSAHSRIAPRFLHENAILPPLMFSACVQALRQVVGGLSEDVNTSGRVEIHFADQEADPYAVELAARVGGYVVGNDSDFVVLHAEGYRGYIPLTQMVWTAASIENDDPQDGDDDGFQTVVNSKAKKKIASRKQFNMGKGIIPPADMTELQLSVSVYSPSALADHLQVPLSLLPLLGALAGNDFTGNKDPSYTTTAQETNLQWLFFERHLTLSQRITRVSDTIRSILAAALAPSTRNKQRQQVHSVMELINEVVTALMVRSIDTMSSGEKERVVERIVEATLQYAIPRYTGDNPGSGGLWESSICALHDEETCPLFRNIARPINPDAESHSPSIDGPQNKRDDVRMLYIKAYRAGRLDPHILDAIYSGTFWHRLFLEDPDLENVARSVIRPIQGWLYALVDDALGLEPLPDEEQDTEKVGEEEENEDEDELIDVMEESDEEDPLAPLRGALQQLDGSPGAPNGETESEPSKTKPRVAKPKVVTEYLRSGTRVASEEVTVTPLQELLSNIGGELQDERPVALRPAPERLTILLKVLNSDHALVRSLPPEQLIAALSLRWIVSRMDARAQENQASRVRAFERWTQQEARAFLASLSFASPSIVQEASEDAAPIVNRHVQLTAQALVTIGAIERLSQTLLLDDQFPAPTLRFSGRRFHSYLTGTQTVVSEDITDRLWDACVVGLETAFGEPFKKRGKEKRSTQPIEEAPTTKAGKKKSGPVGGMFGLLGNVEA